MADVAEAMASAVVIELARLSEGSSLHSSESSSPVSSAVGVEVVDEAMVSVVVIKLSELAKGSSPQSGEESSPVGSALGADVGRGTAVPVLRREREALAPRPLVVEAVELDDTIGTMAVAIDATGVAE